VRSITAEDNTNINRKKTRNWANGVDEKRKHNWWLLGAAADNHLIK
jgi:hypothetical protein